MLRTPAFLSAVLLAWLICTAASSLLGQVVIQNRAMIVVVNLRVWKDPGKSVALTEIDWGLLEPGSSKSVTAYIEAAGTVPCFLSLTTSSWVPAGAATYITLSWDSEGVKLQPGELRQVAFTLYVAKEISGVSSFSFQIVITGSS